MTASFTSEVERIMGRAVPSARADFLHAVENEIAMYDSDIAPAYEAADKRPAKLAALARAGNAFAKAVSALDPDALQILEIGFMTIERKQGVEPDDALSRAASSVRQMKRAGENSFYAASNAARLLRQMRRPRKSKSVDGLVIGFAFAYGDAFGERATHSRTGSFAQLVPHLLRHAHVRANVGGDRLHRILKGVTLPGRRRRAGRPAKVK